MQTEFAQNSYQAFIEEMKRISELYVDLLEHSFERAVRDDGPRLEVLIGCYRPAE